MKEADLVHLHFPLPLGISLVLMRALVRRPLVVTVHGNGKALNAQVQGTVEVVAELDQD